MFPTTMEQPKVSELKPEIMQVPQTLTLEQIALAYYTSTTITVSVETILEDRREILVRLNQDMYGVLPFEEATAYELSPVSEGYSLPLEISLLAKRNIAVKVDYINSDGEIYVSRRKNQIEAAEYLSTCDVVTAYVYHINENFAFCDIGDGVCGSVHISNVCATHIRRVEEFLSHGEIRNLKILEPAEFPKKFDLSYKAMAKRHKIARDEFVTGIIKEAIYSESKITGYRVAINPATVGIVDVFPSTPELKYGMRVRCLVWGSSPRGLKLRLNKILEDN